MIVTYRNLVDIKSTGIIVKKNDSNFYICFEECARNYAKENSLERSKCVATRDITRLMFTFYTNPKTIISFKKRSLKELVFNKSSVDLFLKLQKTINELNYTTFDMS